MLAACGVAIMTHTHHLTLSAQTARRLSLVKQRLAGEQAPPTADGILDVVRSIRCLQLDPISAVARSHTLVTFSRVGPYAPQALDELLWQRRALFEYWAHAASIVLTEDYPLHLPMMRQRYQGDTDWERKVREWADANAPLRQFILDEIREKGPRLSRQLEGEGIHPSDWVSTGWTSGRNVSRMLDHLWVTGEICVAGRVGGQKQWDLTERVFPHIASASPPPSDHVTDEAIVLALGAMGIGRPKEINYHFIRNRYGDMRASLHRLQAKGRLLAARIIGDDGRALTGPHYVLASDVPLIEKLERGDDYGPRTTLLSPFDNLICDRERTRQLFKFDFNIEIYVPKDKRKFGYYVLPIVHEDRLIGRVDSSYDKKAKRYDVHSVFAEDDAPASADTAKAVRGAIGQLAQFLGAQDITFTERVPSIWKRALKA